MMEYLWLLLYLVSWGVLRTIAAMARPELVNDQESLFQTPIFTAAFAPAIVAVWSLVGVCVIVGDIYAGLKRGLGGKDA
jgi:hypothetical protein